MSRRGTVLRVTPSIEREFHSAVIANLPDLTDEEMHKWNCNKGELGYLLREALLSNRKSVGENVFSITCKGLTASELVAAGKYDWANDAITDKKFPIESQAPVTREIELVGFDRDLTSEEVLAEFARRGLERPTYEDALTFGVQHPEEQRKHPVVFLHEPVQAYDSDSVVVLDEIDRKRYLNLYWFGLSWPRGCVFAGVRPA